MGIESTGRLTDSSNACMHPPSLRAGIGLLASLGWLLLLAGANRAAARPPKRIGEMTVQEVRDEVHRLYKNDLPYAKYIRAITDVADDAWPKLNEPERIRLEVDVYSRLMDALQLLNKEIDLPYDAATRTYLASVDISLALDASKLGKQNMAFYQEVFASREFNQSDSAYRDTVIELWKKYEKSGKVVPYAKLLMLNQSKMGRPDGLRGDSILAQIAEMYGELGDHHVEASWYLKVSPAGLGPLKAADAFFAAQNFPAAAAQYKQVLADLDSWAVLKPELRNTALAEPLEFADLTQIREHATRTLTELKRIQGPSTTRASP
jgi:hypothetical protein